MLEMIPNVSRSRAINFTKRHSCPKLLIDRIHRNESIHHRLNKENQSDTNVCNQSSILSNSQNSTLSKMSLYQQVLSSQSSFSNPEKSVKEIHKSDKIKSKSQIDLKDQFQKDFGEIDLTSMSYRNNSQETMLSISESDSNDKTILNALITNSSATSITNQRKLSQVVYCMMTSVNPSDRLDI
jgi:hypothetical protein